MSVNFYRSGVRAVFIHYKRQKYFSDFFPFWVVTPKLISDNFVVAYDYRWRKVSILFGKNNLLSPCHDGCRFGSCLRFLESEIIILKLFFQHLFRRKQSLFVLIDLAAWLINLYVFYTCWWRAITRYARWRLFPEVFVAVIFQAVMSRTQEITQGWVFYARNFRRIRKNQIPPANGTCMPELKTNTSGGVLSWKCDSNVNAIRGC